MNPAAPLRMHPEHMDTWQDDRAPGVATLSVADLLAAWHTVAGTGPPPATTTGGSAALPGAVAVLGCHGLAGASTLALALATAIRVPARVVEAAGAGRSGLAGAATAELGPTGTGWVRGRRDQVVLDRLAGDHATPAHLPLPDVHPPHTGGCGTDGGQPVPVVLDVGWDVHVLASAGGWLPTAITAAHALVLVTTATVPGMFRLDAALRTLDLDPDEPQVVVAVRGPVPRRWPRPVSHAPTPRCAALLDRALVAVPQAPGLAVAGLDTAPLPTGLLDTAARILTLTGLPGSPLHPQEGTTHVR